MTLEAVLVLAAFLCALVAGFLFAFAVVVMPGLGTLPDGAFLRAFQRIDAVIQRGQPLFGLVWLGSALALVAGLVLGLGQLETGQAVLLALAGGIYLVGVQAETFVVHIPLNNELQELDVADADDETLRRARQRFEPRWNRWNRIRTVLAALTTALLMVVLLSL